jgi:outer membrane protein
VLAAALAIAVTPAVQAQEPTPATLTLEEAIRLAVRNNPAYRSTLNDGGVADWQVRSAYASLLPSLGVGAGASYQAAGKPELAGGLNAEDFGITATPAYLSSSYSLGMSLRLDGGTFFGLAQQRASRAATDARIVAARYDLAANVTNRYLAARRAQDNVALQRQVVETAAEALRLAEARMDVGEGMRLDVAQAEVNQGRAEVGLIQAEHAFEIAKLALLQEVGVELDRDIELSSAFEVFEPDWELQALLDQAQRTHPRVEAARRSEAATAANSRAARMSYLPSLNFSAGWSGSTRAVADDQVAVASARRSKESSKQSCESQNELNARLTEPLPGYPRDCSGIVFTAEDEALALAANSLFPFDFTNRPPSFSMSVSLPIFNGFNRELQVQQASAAAEDARMNTRAEELSRRSQVTTAFLAVDAAHRTVALEERNAATAAEQLELAQERYRLGLGSILELSQAQEGAARADQALLAARYAFFDNLAALESAVGGPLR